MEFTPQGLLITGDFVIYSIIAMVIVFIGYYYSEHRRVNATRNYKIAWIEKDLLRLGFKLQSDVENIVFKLCASDSNDRKTEITVEILDRSRIRFSAKSPNESEFFKVSGDVSNYYLCSKQLLQVLNTNRSKL